MRSLSNHRIPSTARTAFLVLLVGCVAYLGVIFVAVRAESHLLMSVGGILTFSSMFIALFAVSPQPWPVWRSILFGLLCACGMLIMAEIFWTIPLLSIGEVQRRKEARQKSVDHEPPVAPMQ